MDEVDVAALLAGLEFVEIDLEEKLEQYNLTQIDQVPKRTQVFTQPNFINLHNFDA